MSGLASTSFPRRSSRLASHPSKNPTTSSKQLDHSHITKKNLPKPSAPQMLYLRVNCRFLLQLPAPTVAQPDPQPLPPAPGTTGNLNVLIANLADLRPFAGNTVDWLIKVARLLFEPLGMSSLYTFTTASLEWWLDREMELTSWRLVVPGEQLGPTIYEFRPNNDAFIALTKMSVRFPRSVTTIASQNQATQFHNTLFARHQGCIVTHEPYPDSFIASHLIPRCLGDAGVQSTFQRFTGSPVAVNRYDPLIGVPLIRNLDYYVDKYNLGFWNSGPNQYVIHNFSGRPLALSGISPRAPNEQMCHGYDLTLTTFDPTLALPPAGVFNWHYTQCVLTRFSAADYRAFNNIYHFALPFRTRDDEDDGSDRDFDDERNIQNPPYPSYLIELSEFRAHQHLEAVEQDHTIAAWNSGVQAGI